MSGKTEERYLVDDPDREKQALAVFMEHGLRDSFLDDIGINQPWWVIQNYQKRRLGENGGDIDLLIGRCEAREGGWFPTSDYLVGVEAKCFYRTFEEDAFGQSRNFKSAKDSHQKAKAMHGQLNWLVDAGLDGIVFLELIANPPVDSFLGAANLAADSLAKASLDVERLMPPLIGHFRMSIGAVGGGTERMRGSVSSPACLNYPELNTVRNPSMREKLRKSLENIFRPQPRSQNIFASVFPTASLESDEGFRFGFLPA